MEWMIESLAKPRLWYLERLIEELLQILKDRDIVHDQSRAGIQRRFLQRGIARARKRNHGDVRSRLVLLELFDRCARLLKLRLQIGHDQHRLFVLRLLQERRRIGDRLDAVAEVL